MEGIIFIPYLILSWLSWDSSSSNWMNLFFITEFIGSMLVFVAEDGFKDFLHKLYATIIGGIIVDTLIVIIWMGKRALYETIPYEDGLFRLLLDCIALIMVIVGIPFLYTLLTVCIPKLIKTFFKNCKQKKKIKRRNEILNELYSKIRNIKDYNYVVCNSFDEDKMYLYDNKLKFMEYEGKKMVHK